MSMRRLLAWLFCVQILAASAAAAATPGVLRATLPNGLRVVIVPNALAPVVTTEINYLVGSNDAPDGFPGTAHALEHMMFRGSQELGRDQLSEIGALLGGQSNADTTETVTQYFYTVPATDLAVPLRIEAGRMRGLLLNQADWEQERGAIEQEVSRDLSSPFYRYASQAQAILFAGTPYEHDALGTRDSFDRTDAALLRNFYDRWYAPNNAILVVAGDVDPQAAMQQVQAAFGAIPRRDIPAHRSVSAGPMQAQTLALKTNFPVGLVTLAYRLPGLRDPDFAAADMLSDVLGSQRGPLFALVPTGQALQAQFSNQPKSDVGSGLALAAFPRGADPQPLLDAMRAAIAGIVRDGVSPDLVEASRRGELAQLAYARDSISGLAETWSRALAFQGLDAPDDIARAYAAVTVDDINRVAHRLLDPSQAVTAILTPQDSGKPIAGSGFGGAESFGSAPDKPVALPDWASAALAELHLPVAGPSPDVTILPNGLRLVVQPLQAGHTVSVYGQVRQVPGTQEPPGKEGVAKVAEAMFAYGSEALGRLGFQKALDDIAAQEQAGPKFELKVLSPFFEQGMALLAANELHPALAEGDFRVVRQQVAQNQAGELQSPDSRLTRALKVALLPAGDPSLRQGTPDTIEALTLDDVRQFLGAAYRPDLTTIVVLGDVTPEQARHAVEAGFGGWEAPAAAASIDPPPVPQSRPSHVQVPDPAALQDTVALAETVQLPVTDPTRFDLMLGNIILGDGFSSRLYRDLRTRTGYVYTVDSTLHFAPTRTQYIASFGSDPQNVAAATSLLVQNIRRMQDEPVSEAELQRAKAQVLRQLQMQRASVDDSAALDLRLAELELPLDTEVTAAKRYLGATTEEVRDAFRTYLRPDDLAQIIKGPAP